jgi:hypothetical protein
MPAKMKCEEFLRLYNLLKKDDKLDESTYVNASTKARFIDPEHGDYWARPSAIIFGSVLGHKKRRIERAIATKIRLYGSAGRRKRNDR